MAERSILITGCSSGIGLTVAEGLAARGWRVFATARKPEDVFRLQALGLDALQLDVTDDESIATALQVVLARTGGTLDALFNNAGYGQPGAVEDLTRGAIREQFETNLFGALSLTNQVIPVMRAQGHGRLLFNSSILGFCAMPMRGAYNASKFAMEGLVDTLRLELHGTGIHPVLIEPGPIVSRFRPNALEAFQRHIHPEHSVHRAYYERVSKRLSDPKPQTRFTMGPEAVLAACLKALDARRPATRYRVTRPTQFFWYLKQVLPTRVLDWAAKKAGG